MSAAGELVFTFLACADLRRIWEALAMPSDPWGGSVQANLARAEAFARGFSEHCRGIAGNPQAGRERDDLLHGLRSSAFERYLVFYRLRGERIEVLRVMRADRDVPPGA